MLGRKVLMEIYCTLAEDRHEIRLESPQQSLTWCHRRWYAKASLIDGRKSFSGPGDGPDVTARMRETDVKTASVSAKMLCVTRMCARVEIVRHTEELFDQVASLFGSRSVCPSRPEKDSSQSMLGFSVLNMRSPRPSKSKCAQFVSGDDFCLCENRTTWKSGRRGKRDSFSKTPIQSLPKRFSWPPWCFYPILIEPGWKKDRGKPSGGLSSSFLPPPRVQRFLFLSFPDKWSLSWCWFRWLFCQRC